MNKLKIAKPESPVLKTDGAKKSPDHSFDMAKRLKKIPKPGERRSRAKTDSF